MTRPNILVFCTDDQQEALVRAETMPLLISRLATSGTRFTRAYNCFGLCSPARATLMTGLTATRHGLLTNDGAAKKFTDLGLEESYLARWMHDEGYATFFLGKWFNNYKSDPVTGLHIPPGWDCFHAVDYAYTSSASDNYTLTEYVDGVLGTSGYYKVISNDPSTHWKYAADNYGRLVSNYLASRVGSPQPFFAWVSYVAPTGSKPPPRYKTATICDPDEPTTFPNFNEDTSDKAPLLNLSALTSNQIANMKTKWQDANRCVRAVDDSIEVIFNALATYGLLENTVVIFTTDSGNHFGEHRILQTGSTEYDTAMKTALLVFDGRDPVGRTCDALISNIDVAPTILDLACAPVQQNISGVSFAPFITGDTVPDWREYAYHADGSAYKNSTVIRDDGWKYCQHPTNPVQPPSLYDTTNDPYELTSLHADPQYAGLMAEMEAVRVDLRDD